MACSPYSDQHPDLGEQSHAGWSSGASEVDLAAAVGGLRAYQGDSLHRAFVPGGPGLAQNLKKEGSWLRAASDREAVGKAGILEARLSSCLASSVPCRSLVAWVVRCLASGYTC